MAFPLCFSRVYDLPGGAVIYGVGQVFGYKAVTDNARTRGAE